MAIRSFDHACSSVLSAQRKRLSEPAIGRDIMALERVREPALLRGMFSIAVSHPAEIISLQELRTRIVDGGGLATIAHYLHLLGEAYLVASLPKLAGSAARRRTAPPKLVTLNQGILAAMAAETLDPTQSSSTLTGRRVENACVAHARNVGQEVGNWRAEPHEVDMITRGSWGCWAIEVKIGCDSPPGKTRLPTPGRDSGGEERLESNDFCIV